MQEIDNYNLLVDENKNWSWYLNRAGYGYRISKKDKRVEALFGHFKGFNYYISINRKEYLFKNLMAKTFFRDYDSNTSVTLKDNNPFNVHADNLYLKNP